MGSGIFDRLRGRGQSGKSSKLKRYEGKIVPLNPKFFGPGCEAPMLPASFVFQGGGVGDYINWAAALKYIEAEYTHVDAQVFTSELFIEVAKYLFPKWNVFHHKEIHARHVNGAPLIQPRSKTQLINACGAHLMDLGFWYFLCIDPPPKDFNFLPVINYNGPWKWPELDAKSAYAVFTPGSTTDVREMPVHAFNTLARYTLSKGVTPVFLGKRNLSGGYDAKFLNYDFSLGIDLRERTDLIEATQIMKGAKFVIGLDNGLLHMAGTTDTPVIFGHNIAPVHHRQLRRKKGLTINVFVTEEELGCIGCQAKMRFTNNHDFRNCFFKDVPSKDKQCIAHLFKNDSARWKAAIDKALKANR